MLACFIWITSSSPPSAMINVSERPVRAHPRLIRPVFINISAKVWVCDHQGKQLTRPRRGRDD